MTPGRAFAWDSVGALGRAHHAFSFSSDGGATAVTKSAEIVEPTFLAKVTGWKLSKGYPRRPASRPRADQGSSRRILIEDDARHVGHADLVRESVDALFDTGVLDPETPRISMTSPSVHSFVQPPRGREISLTPFRDHHTVRTGHDSTHNKQSGSGYCARDPPG
jgi:hypothetical protein